ncbi:MAG: IgGFc-binding protein [Polyangia bacterium]|jgi:hypothetical protein|nr:IgGFc-binding protein [Polyangia bacterium]
MSSKNMLGWILGALGLLAACGPTGPSKTNGNDSGVNQLDGALTTCQQAPGQTICLGTEEVVCDSSGVESRRRDCLPINLRCAPDKGCVVCFPGETRCDENTVMTCRSDWMGWEPVVDCDPMQGTACIDGSCKNLCTDAAETRSNVGCDYFAVDMGNIDEGGANEACFAVLVANVQDVGDAVVTVEDQAGTILSFPGYGTERTIAPRQLEIFKVNGNCSGGSASSNMTQMATGIQAGGAYRVKSTLPVVAYQINPYEAATIHTTDAALLIPVPALGAQYMVASYSGLGQAPSSISIVAVEDNTHLDVVPSVTLQAAGPVPATGPFSVVLNRMDHLQLVAEGTGDLSGTLISAGTVETVENVAVFAGAGCAQIPLGKTWCDHLEEQLPPVRSWGWTYIAAPPPQRATEKFLWRIVAAVDDTTIYFEPSYVSAPITLNRGQFETIEAAYPFLVSSDQDHPIEVMNLMKGAQATAEDSGVSVDGLGNLRGDPAITLSVPVEQYLSEYVFLSDPTYAYNFVVVVRSDPSSVIHLDCFDPIPNDRFTPVSGDYAIATINLTSENTSVRMPDGSCQSWGEVHHVWGTHPFGIWVYGYYQDTSYGYPGGMNLEEVNEIIVVQ